MPRKLSQIKPQDIVLLLKLCLFANNNEDSRVIDLAYKLGISPSEISHGLERLRYAKLISDDKKTPLRNGVLEFLVHGLKYAFPASPGYVTRGFATAHSASPLLNQKVSGSDNAYVWPSDKGDMRGESIVPLYPSAPEAALNDKKLYELLALVDAIRVGRAREQKLAVKELEKRIL